MARILKQVMFNDPTIMESKGFKTEGLFHIWLKNTVDGRQHAIALIERRDEGTLVYVDMENVAFRDHKHRASDFM